MEHTPLFASDPLDRVLTIQTAADGLPRNQGEYRILEIDFERLEDPSSRPQYWKYAFWGPWVSRVNAVMKCASKEEVLGFFRSFSITTIDDGMAQKTFPELILGHEPGAYQTIADTITIDVDENRCFIVRDWDRSKRAYRLFEIYSNRELGDWGSDDVEDEDEDEDDGGRMKGFLIP
jgi:hypothetical protein